VWHKDQKVKTLRDGSLEISFPVSDFTEIKMEVLRHGDAVEVMKPKALRDLIREEAENILMVY
jgi:predicted DNA-binding transcriptional regulator YafY